MDSTSFFQIQHFYETSLSAHWFQWRMMHFGLFLSIIYMKQLLHVLIWPNHKRCMCSFIKVIMVPMLLENKYSPAMLRVYSKVSEFLEENCIEGKKKLLCGIHFLTLSLGWNGGYGFGIRTCPKPHYCHSNYVYWLLFHQLSKKSFT